MLVLFLTLLFLALPPPNHSSSSPASAPSASANGGAPSSLATSSRVPRDTKQQPIKVLISDGCTQGDSEGRELELDPGSPLVLTHRIRLVSGGEGGGGGAGGCSSCDDMLAKLRERIERLEREVSDLREKCGGPEGGGCCASEQSKGPGCTVRPATCPDDCSDQGRCVDGRCVCFEGFSGDDCSQAACDPPCDRGKCVNGQCVCDAGFTGLTCSESACSPACVRGRCVNGKCVCDRGFTGPDCSEAACVPACVRGTCVNGQCVCDPGFTGPTCSDAECVPACVRGTCVNGQCVCDPGFTGPTCSDAECVPACDRGTCVNGQCVCDPGFTGPACSEAACDPACVRGRCVNGRCVCDAGFTGADCSEAACKPACKNRGKCVNGKCECAPGFTGSDCGTKGCPNNCSNKGRCVRGKCVCRKGFTGPDCTDCEPGRSGPDCTVGLTGVTGLTAKDITDSSATLVWNQPSVPYDNYDITLTSQKEGDKITSSVGGRLTTYTQTGLAAGQEYHVSITGEKDGQSGPESTTDFVTLISSITNLRLVKTSTTYAIIQWDLPTMEIDRYHLIVTPTSGGTAGQEISLSADVTSTQIDHLVAGVEYDVTLVAERDGIRSAPATIQVVPEEMGETLSMVTANTETKVGPVVPGTDRQRLRPASQPQNGKPQHRPGPIRRPGLPRPANGGKVEAGLRRVPSHGPPRKPGTYPSTPRRTPSPQPDEPTSDTKPGALTGDKVSTESSKGHGESPGGPDTGVSSPEETRDPPSAAEAPRVPGIDTELHKESSRNTTAHPSGKKCHPKLIVGHPHLNGTIKAKLPVIRNMTHATDEEKVSAFFKELQQHSIGPRNTSSEEQGINLHISVFEVSPGHDPNIDLSKNALASTGGGGGSRNNDHISISTLSLGLPSSAAQLPPSPGRRPEAAAELPRDSRHFAENGKPAFASASTESSDFSESTEDGAFGSSGTSSEESPQVASTSRAREKDRTSEELANGHSGTGTSEEQEPAASQPSSFPKPKFTRRPGLGAFQNRTRPFLGGPHSPSRGGLSHRGHPYRGPNGGAVNRSLPLPTGGAGDTDTSRHPNQRPGGGVVFRKRNDTRAVRPGPIRPELAHAAFTTAPPQPHYTTTPPHRSHPHDKVKLDTSEEDTETFPQRGNGDRVRNGGGHSQPRHPGLVNGRPRHPGLLNGNGKYKPRPGGPLRKRPLLVTKTTPRPGTHLPEAPHATTPSTRGSIHPTEDVAEGITSRAQSQNVNSIDGIAKPGVPRKSIPETDPKPGLVSSKPRPGLAIRTRNGTVSQTPSGHKPARRPLRPHGSAKISTSDDQQGVALDHVGVHNISHNAVTLAWDAPQGLFNNFVVTRKTPVKGGVESRESEGGEGAIERGNKGQEGEDVAANMAETGTTDISGSSSQPSSPNDTSTKVLPGTARSFLFKGLHPQTRYVLSVFGDGPGGRSKTHSVTINTGPEPPTNLIFSDLTDTTVSVSWTKPRSPVTGFKVTYTHTQEGEPVSVTVGASESTVDLSGLTPGSSYEVNIISQLDLDESDPLKDMLHTLPDPPTGLQAINITDSKALLLWRPALAAVDNYVIVYGSANGPEVTVSVSGNAAAQQLEQLESTTEYSVTITSHLGNRKSSGATTTFTTTGGGGGLLPQDLTATQITPRSALLTWKPPAATVSGYKLQYAIEGQAFQDVFVSGELLEQRLLRLRPGSKYVVRLQAEIGGVYTEAITTEFTTGALRFPFPTDCSQELLNGMHESGLADIFPLGEDSTPISVYCDQETDGGGWTVLQRRMNGKVDFFKSWKEYVSGFGDRSEEFWLGNDLLHNLTKMTPMSLRVDMRAEGETVFAKYSSFSVGPAKFYTLKVSGYTGTAGDSMTYHNGRHFSTRDRDRSDIRFCAMSYRGGWWYRNCHEANLNGVYGTDRNHQGVIWTTWKGKEYSIPFVEMKMRPTSFRPPSQG
ncbi:tenascin isoform X1 [Engraulis encrasicolus]|uniref:tenascin isoform X1 n=1 Tax=Engraulis encrasicolus TaxID=184585 RepID=UPI002FD2498B